MGLPAVPLKSMRAYIEMVRTLLKGEEVMYREGGRERAIRFLHQNHGYINMKDRIPIHIAADGPKALELAGELGDGWLTVLSNAQRFRQKRESVLKGAARAGKSVAGIPMTVLGSGCVLRDGESMISPRVLERIGPFAVVFLHALWEACAVATGAAGTAC